MTDSKATNDSPEDAPVVSVPVEKVPAAPADDTVGITNVTGSVPAQVTGPPHPVKTTQAVQEATYVTDRVILDTSDPLAVQVPEPDESKHPFGITV